MDDFMIKASQLIADDSTVIAEPKTKKLSHWDSLQLLKELEVVVFLKHNAVCFTINFYPVRMLPCIFQQPLTTEELENPSDWVSLFWTQR